MTFTIINLAGDRALVKGRDAQNVYSQQILDAAEWNEFKARNAHHEAHDAFDVAVEEFFAPLNAAVDALKDTSKPQLDPLFFVTMQEGTAAVEAQHEVLVHLHQHSAILRLIEQDPDTDRLIWVNDSLEILAPVDAPAPAVQGFAIPVPNEDGTGEDENFTKA